MNKLMKLNWFLILISIVIVSCTKEKKFVIDPPIAGLETKFTEIDVDPQKDSVYVLENDTRIAISKGSLLDNLGNQINESVPIQFRQFDDAVSIFLSGLPMQYVSAKNNMMLETAGMYEIRGEYNGASVQVDQEKPLTVTLGSFFDNSRQGFFKLDEETGDWDLVDIPDAKYNEEVILLNDKLSKLKPEWVIPLPPNYYVFSLGRMADIFLGNDWSKIREANMDALKKKMQGYGVSALDVYSNYLRLKYKGNYYDAGEMLWKAPSELHVPKWARAYPLFDDWIRLEKISGNRYKLRIRGSKENQIWTTELELVSHLRYLIRYTPEQLIAKEKQIEKEIQETEERLKKLRLIEYTTEIYEMGIYNCDKPVYFRTGKPQLNFLLDGMKISEQEIHKISIFNENLSSYAVPTTYKPVTCSFFKGTNKIVLITKTGEIALFSGEDFNALDSLAIEKSATLEISLQKVEVDNEEELRNLLKE